MEIQWYMHVLLYILLAQTLCSGSYLWNYNRTPLKRSKRNSGNDTTYNVEVLAVLDFSMFDYFHKTTNETDGTSDVTRKLHQHMAQTFKEIDGRFETMRSQNLDIHIQLSDVYIIKEKKHSIWLSNEGREILDASATLASFQKWLMTSRKLESFDHAMLFTRYDITKDDANEIAGLAYLERMCSTDSVSLVEDRDNSVLATIAAHELAHSLGALHDGSGNSCSNSMNFIMSDTSTITRDTITNRNSWKFSSCSVNYAKMFISSLHRHNCLRQQRATTEDAITLSDSGTNIVTSPDEQCRRLEGQDSSLCRALYKGNYSDFCALLMCHLDETSCSYALPRDGTACGYNKLCQFGHCVSQDKGFESTPQKYQESCPFGDQPGVVSTLGSTCEKTITDKPYLCYDVIIVHTCCESCDKQYLNMTGCEYGDKELCQSVNIVTCILDSSTCCGSCKGTSATGLVIVFILGVIAVTMVIVTLYITTRRYCKPKTETTPSSRTAPSSRTTPSLRETPSLQQTTPSSQQTTPTSQQTTPSSRTTPYLRETPSSRTAPSLRATPSSRTAPSLRATPSLQQTTHFSSPQKTTPSSRSQQTTPSSRTTPSLQQTTPPLQQTTLSSNQIMHSSRTTPSSRTLPPSRTTPSTQTKPS